jgi:hypothetical protein
MHSLHFTDINVYDFLGTGISLHAGVANYQHSIHQTTRKEIIFSYLKKKIIFNMLHLVLWLLQCKSKYILQLCRQQLAPSTPFFHIVPFILLMIHVIDKSFKSNVFT